METTDFLLPFQQQLLDQVDLALEEVRAGGNSQGILLMGPSGTGKSHGLDLVVERYGENRMEGYQRIKTCCRVAASTKADAYTTVAGVLAQLGKPMASARGKANLMDLESSMQAALLAQKVQILIFEEFHNAMLSGSPQLRGQTARLLKNLWNQSPLEAADHWAVPNLQRGDHRLIIIISGTDELRVAFEKDKELSSRFACIVKTAKLDFQPLESVRNFRLVLGRLAARFGLAHLLNPDDDAIASRFLAACEAHLRVLEKLLQRIATLYRRSPVEALTLEFLATAYDSMGALAHPLGNPFRCTDEEMVAHIVRSRSLKKVEAVTEPKPDKKAGSAKKAKGSH